MAHVFISYAHEDGDFGDILINKLRAEGITHWVDSEHLRTGEDWREGIDDAIRDSFALIVVMSPAAKASEYVTYEWAFAWGLGVQIIPVLYKTTDMHPRLEILQYFDFRNRNSRPWEELVELLRQEAGEYTPRSQSVAQPDIGTSRLIADLSSEDHHTRRKAAIALGNIGDKSAVPTLIAILEDEKWTVRREAAHALGKIGDVSASRSLIRVLHNDQSIRVGQTAVWALGNLRAKKQSDRL